MTYGGFLWRYLVIPILLLTVVTWYDARRGRRLPASLHAARPAVVVGVLVVVAVAYTTPWDNYLVATDVWSYDPALVWGITLGYVPLEEYFFFVLQTVMVGLWLLSLMRRLPPGVEVRRPRRVRALALGGAAALWLLSVGLLAADWQPARYLALLLAWALPPMMLQLGVGADILLAHRAHVLGAILSATLYLSLVDALAIDAGTWTITPTNSLEVYVLGVLPVEELIFFLITNILIVFGAQLALARVTWQRLPFGWGRRASRGAAPSSYPD